MTTILVVEDAPDLSQLISREFEALEYHVLLARMAGIDGFLAEYGCDLDPVAQYGFTDAKFRATAEKQEEVRARMASIGLGSGNFDAFKAIAAQYRSQVMQGVQAGDNWEAIEAQLKWLDYVVAAVIVGLIVWLVVKRVRRGAGTEEA